MRWWAAVARLASILAGVGLATTRLGLVAHELIGHGGTAIACGGRVLDARLFWFAGGWIRYDLPPSEAARLAVALGGIVLELVIGVALWLAVRRPTLGAKILRATGAAIAIHASWYLAVGTYHGFGDGWLLRRVAGDGRYAIAIGAGLVTVTFAYLGARSILGVLADTLPSRRVIGLVVAALLAGGLQLGLAVGEMKVRGDTTYGAIMQPERERVIAQELASWERAQHGAIDEAIRRAREAQLRQRHRELPFKYILGALAILAIVGGAVRAKHGSDEPLRPRLVAVIGAVGVGSVVLVIAIDTLFV